MLNELSSRFLKVLKYLIEEHEVSDNKDFASKISVSTSMITEISKGRSNVGLSAIQNTVLQFPINSDWLLTGRGYMLRDDKNNEESKLGYTPNATPISSVEESIMYKMCEKKDEENKELNAKMLQMAEEIGSLKAQLGKLSGNSGFESGQNVKPASTKPHLLTSNPSVSYVKKQPKNQ